LKNALIISLTLIFLSCEPKVQNDLETIDYLFSNEKFDVEIGVYGCFGGGTDSFEMERKEYGYLFTSKKYKFQKLIKPREIDSLKMFLRKLIKTDSTSLLLRCTSTTYFRVNTFSKAINSQTKIVIKNGKF
jgi:hypothetical protein